VNDNYHPHIVGFLCNWCTYAGADRAGSSKLEVSPAIHVIRVMCSSRVEPTLVLNSLLWGADGVIVAGCHPGDCHYKEGNYYTRRRFAQLKKVLEAFDLEPERIELAWVSASEGQRYADVMNKFAKDISALGANPIKNTPF
jgi:F420-non-reducing hydrogenase iron-sulfur subunit